uniref:Uncharacterized protein n=1 Tax=Magallana gigas TaxID=29159 RepID=A0A8W8HTC3_MAGGI
MVEFNPMKKFLVRRENGSGVNEDTILGVRKWLTKGVDVTDFFTCCKGNFRGKSFDSEWPPSAVFLNSALCKKYHAFICDVLYEKIRSGATRVLGKVGEREMPHNFMPLTIEPSKPRLCHYDRFFNLWVKDLPFQLKTLRDVHRLEGCNAFLIATDEKSRYDSRGYFGLIYGCFVGSLTRAVKSSKHVCLTDELREELEHWGFLDSWEGCCQWRSEDSRAGELEDGHQKNSRVFFGSTLCTLWTHTMSFNNVLSIFLDKRILFVMSLTRCGLRLPFAIGMKTWIGKRLLHISP